MPNVIELVSAEIREVVPSFPVHRCPLEFRDSFLREFSEARIDGLAPYEGGPMVVATGEVFVGTGVEIQPFNTLSGRVVLRDGVRVGPYSFLRGPLYVGENTLVGPYSEITRTALSRDCMVSHKNIVVDSVVGRKTHIAAYTWIANLNLHKRPTKVCFYDAVMETRQKYGAVFEGDTTIGAGVCLMPGTFVPAQTVIVGPALVSGPCKVRAFGG